MKKLSTFLILSLTCIGFNASAYEFSVGNLQGAVMQRFILYKGLPTFIIEFNKNIRIKRWQEWDGIKRGRRHTYRNAVYKDTDRCLIVESKIRSRIPKNVPRIREGRKYGLNTFKFNGDYLDIRIVNNIITYKIHYMQIFVKDVTNSTSLNEIENICDNVFSIYLKD